ncbi:MAG: hypothetical protein Q8Q94_02390 [bacterium]|nr:hypothetical protein [bacterium]MDZ4299599.1 hypothetical protein [Candidatus Sungbacteria bacterium]
MMFSMTCDCGEKMSVEAENRDEAVMKMKAMMTQEMLQKHWTEKHAADAMPMPSLTDCHMMIEKNLAQV